MAAAKTRRAPARKAKLDLLDQTTADEAVKFANELNVQTLTESMAALQTRVQGSLAGLSAELLTKLEESQRLDLAITEKSARVKELTGKEAAAVTLDELNIEIEETKAEWERAKALREVKWGDEYAQQEQDMKRKQEAAEYEYNQRLARINAELASQVEANKRSEDIRQQDLQRGWALREEELKAQEQEVAALRQQVVDFPAQLDAAVTKAVAETTTRLENNAKHQIELMERDSKAEVALAQQRLTASQQQVAALQTQIAALVERAENAEKSKDELLRNAFNVEAEKRRADTALQAATTAGGKGGK